MFLWGRREAVRSPLRASPRWDRRALVCCLIVMLVLGGSLAYVLLRAGERRSGTNGVWVQQEAPIAAGSTACQERELLPADTVALQIPGVASGSPIVTLRQGGRLLARVAATSDARRQVVEASIRRTSRDRSNVELCLHARGHTTLYVGPTPPQVGALTVDGSATETSAAVSYLQPGRRSWWAYAPTVAARACEGHGGWDPCWNVWAVAGLLAVSLVLAGRLVLRTLVSDRGMSRTAVTIAAVAVLNAAAWSFITPPFQVPDEVAHVAYVQSMGETGAPPADARAIVVSPEQSAAMASALFGEMYARTLHAAAWAPAQQRRIVAEGRQPLPRRASIAQGEGEPEPPLYYALESIPYRAASGSTLLDRMLAMRLLSAAFAGVTALLCFLFVRECLPGRRWAWTVGGLGVAFVPMLGFVSGGVNPDALLFALSAALFVCVARAWRRGVTLRLALVLGALIAAGMLTKVNFYGLVPGVALGFALAARRSEGAWNGRVLRLLGATALLAGGLFLAATGFEAVVWHRSLQVGRPAAPESHVGLLDHVAYIWQVFLPRLPFQPRTTLTEPGYQQLFKTFVGAFGWLVVWLPVWAYRAAAAALVAIGLLAVRMLRAEPRELRWRRREAIGYAAMAGVLLLMVGLSVDLRRDILHIVQGRYLLPLLPLFGLFLALGARGAGERWGRAFGVAVVAGVVAWSLLGQLMTIAFFYS
jgi:Predicted membrane protein (DUF2142)